MRLGETWWTPSKVSRETVIGQDGDLFSIVPKGRARSNRIRSKFEIRRNFTIVRAKTLTIADAPTLRFSRKDCEPFLWDGVQSRALD